MSQFKYQQLLDEITQGRTVIKEKVFKALAPFFFERNTLDDKTYQYYLHKWLEIVKDPRVEAYIADDDDMEKILHRIPPIVFTNHDVTGKGIGNLMKEWEYHQNVSSLHGKRFADKIDFKSFIEGKPSQQDIDDWQLLVAKYHHKQAIDTNINDVELTDEEW